MSSSCWCRACSWRAEAPHPSRVQAPRESNLMAAERCELLAFRHSHVRQFVGLLDKTLTAELSKSVTYQLLHRLQMFKGIDSETLEQLSALLSLRTLDEGHTLFRQGEVSN
mmetsp:Transcript_21952/g.51061  ORF Transcript_21952/g.51061 Transcript_21952/m.51061 type:complete len:111 (-) Transcript_21952:155-487(-)